MKISIEQANKLLSALHGGAVVVANEAEADTDANLEVVIDNIGESIGSEWINLKGNRVRTV